MGLLLGWPSSWRIILIMEQQKPTGTAAWGLSALRKRRIWRRQRLRRRWKVWKEYKCPFRHSYLFYRLSRKVILWSGWTHIQNKRKSQEEKESMKLRRIILNLPFVRLTAERSCWICGTSFTSDVFGCHWKISTTRKKLTFFLKEKKSAFLSFVCGAAFPWRAGQHQRPDEWRHNGGKQ